MPYDVDYKGRTKNFNITVAIVVWTFVHSTGENKLQTYHEDWVKIWTRVILQGKCQDASVLCESMLYNPTSYESHFTL